MNFPGPGAMLMSMPNGLLMTDAGNLLDTILTLTLY